MGGLCIWQIVAVLLACFDWITLFSPIVKVLLCSHVRSFVDEMMEVPLVTPDGEEESDGRLCGSKV